LIGVCTLLHLSLSGWIVLVVGSSMTLRSQRLMRAVTPRLLRRALFVGTVGTLTFVPAHADPAAAPGHAPMREIAGLRLPDRPIGRELSPAVVVRAGDTLWAIASASLPDGSSDADIASACARWHTANREVIGDDPDLIFPAQRLSPPPGKDSS
jgi:nucleoid-associated protein YgaU